MYKASLIISVYDNVRFLKVVLDSLKLQTEKDFEIIISEDAAHQEMKAFIADYSFVNDYKHITQSDEGWRKNRALNNAIKASSADWLILIDGDCALHPRFVEFHVKRAQPNRILAGKRIKLNPLLSTKLIEDVAFVNKLQSNIFNHLFSSNKHGLKFIEEGLFINPKGFLGLIPQVRKMTQLKGCNMSFSKAAITAINGFDEDYTLPAIGEDIDLTWRFQSAGYKLKSVRNLAVQYHLYHKENWTSQEENIALMNMRKAENAFICKNGLEKL